MKKSDITNTDEYFQKYLKLDKEEDMILSLENSLKYCIDFIKNLPEEKFLYRYEPEKWTIKDILSHLIDSERIFAYRALCIARNDKKELPGYEQDDYVRFANVSYRKIQDILDDFSSARKSNIALFNSFDDEMLIRKGIANKREISVLTVAFLLSGHVYHHLNIIKERYL